MRIEGEIAKQYKVIRLDFMTTVAGELIMADEATGEVKAKQSDGSQTNYQFPANSIRIMLR